MIHRNPSPARFKKTTAGIVVSACVLLGLAGCGALHDFLYPSRTQSAESAPATFDLTKLLAGRIYFRMGSDVFCKANDPGRTVIRSWANKVTFNDKEMLIWGPVCNDSPELVPIKDAIDQIHVSLDLKSLLYKGEVLKFHPEPPRLCDSGTWCPK